MKPLFRRGLLLSILLVPLALPGACGRSGLRMEVEGGSPTPTATGSIPPGSPTPGGTPPIEGYGDGHDGEREFIAATTLNDCRPVPAASGTDLEIDGDAAPFGTGRLVLVVQMQDDFLGTAQSGDGTPVTAPGEAGRWEIARIAGVSGNLLAVDPPLANVYASAAGAGEERAQACTVPEYSNVRVGADLSATPWDGSSGGVLALFVSGALQLDERLLAAGAGFRGGIVRGADGSNGQTGLDFPANDFRGGGKGEGLDGSSWPINGRGNYGSAAGGGNARDGGGGGGGNGGAGGFGGEQDDSDGGGATTRGMPGSAVQFTTTTGELPVRIVPGGGGGAGHADANAAQGGAGGAGGGLVLVFAATIAGDGVIRADGADGFSSTSNNGEGEGAGGGGAGGTIVLKTDDGNGFTGILRARGGAGGSVAQTGNEARGGGGGGGGGRIYRLGLSSGSVFVDGGARGNSGSSADQANGATGGQSGVTVP